jgi:iron complex outermembrane receptor protein
MPGRNPSILKPLLAATTALAASTHALAAEQTTGPVTPAQAAAPDAPPNPDEIIITATKRPERARKISGSVTAFDERQLEAVGARGMADYLTRTPGTVFNASIPGDSSATIRGISTTTGIAQAQGTTGYFIDDVPLTDPFFSAGIPDIDTFDVDNIVILRGPQGTLFGSASLGGAINYEATRPDLDTFDLHLRGGLDSTSHGEPGFGAHAMANVPIIAGKLAVRGVLYHRRDGGYVDNVGTGKRDSNRTDVTGGRILATFAPGPHTTVNYLFLQQTDKTDDVGSAQQDLGRDEKSTLVPEPFKFRTTIHNLRLDQDIGSATLTATATRHIKRFATTQDFSGLVPSLAPVSFLEGGSSKGNTFEVRLASRTGARFEYLVGAYHDSTKELVTDILDAPVAQPIFGTSRLLEAPVHIKGDESALFGEATWHFTDQLKATLGGRLFRTKLDITTSQSGPFVGGTITTAGGSRENGFSPKASITWQPDQDHLIYALVSKGFRFGGPNFTIDPTFPIPSQFKSDSLINYEIGARTNLIGRKLELDGTLFTIDWNDIQVTQTSPGGFTFTANAGKARSRGAELNLLYRPANALRLQAGITYLDATIGRDFESPGGIVPSGARLPGASRWQISDSVSYTFVDTRTRPTILLSHRYISRAPGELTPDPVKQGGYNLIDARLTADFGRFTAAAFVDNIGNVRGVTEAVTGVRGPVQFLVRPRTIGLTLDYRL